MAKKTKTVAKPVAVHAMRGYTGPEEDMIIGLLRMLHRRWHLRRHQSSEQARNIGRLGFESLALTGRTCDDQRLFKTVLASESKRFFALGRYQLDVFVPRIAQLIGAFL